MNYNRGLEALRDQLEPNDAFTTFRDTPANAIAISVVAFMFGKDDSQVKEDLQSYFDRESERDEVREKDEQDQYRP